MGQLWKFIEQHQDSTLYGASVREIARGAGIKESTLPRWQNLKRMPEPEHLRALARHINVPYRVLLDAALADTGYLDARPEREEGEDRGNAAPNTPAGDDPAPTELDLRRARENGRSDEQLRVVQEALGGDGPARPDFDVPALAAAYDVGRKSFTEAERHAAQAAAAAAMDPTIPDDVAARSETGKGKTQKARERQDREGESS